MLHSVVVFSYRGFMADFKSIAVKKSVAEKQILFAEVYAPNITDSHGDWMNAEEIEKMAYNFARHGRLNKVDMNHDNNLYGCCIVETFIARADDPIFIPGSWVVGIHVPDPTIWAKVKSGELNGLSMECLCLKKSVDVEIHCPAILQGVCEKSQGDDHTHDFTVHVDENGEFAGGFTSVVNGHSHQILSGSVTEEAAGHTHRYCFADKVTELNDE